MFTHAKYKIKWVSYVLTLEAITPLQPLASLRTTCSNYKKTLHFATQCNNVCHTILEANNDFFRVSLQH